MDVAHLIKQKSYEKILYKMHRHPITFVPILALFLVLMFVPPTVYFLIDSIYPDLLDGSVLYAVTITFGTSLKFLKNFFLLVF